MLKNVSGQTSQAVRVSIDRDQSAAEVASEWRQLADQFDGLPGGTRLPVTLTGQAIRAAGLLEVNGEATLRFGGQQDYIEVNAAQGHTLRGLLFGGGGNTHALGIHVRYYRHSDSVDYHEYRGTLSPTTHISPEGFIEKGTDIFAGNGVYPDKPASDHAPRLKWGSGPCGSSPSEYRVQFPLLSWWGNRLERHFVVVDPRDNTHLASPWHVDGLKRGEVASKYSDWME